MNNQRQRIAHGLAHHATSLAQFGAAAKTLTKDDCAHARAQWRAFSDVYGFDPIVARAEAVQNPDLLSARLGLFLLWVYPHIRGQGRTDAHPRSVLTHYPGAVTRILRRDHQLPKPPCEAEARGLLRSYKRVYGTHALAGSAPSSADNTITLARNTSIAPGSGAGRPCRVARG